MQGKKKEKREVEVTVDCYVHFVYYIFITVVFCSRVSNFPRVVIVSVFATKIFARIKLKTLESQSLNTFISKPVIWNANIIAQRSEDSK